MSDWVEGFRGSVRRHGRTQGAKGLERSPLNRSILAFGIVVAVLAAGPWATATPDGDDNEDAPQSVDVAPDPRPSPRAGHRMVYDSESERVILLGGGSPFGTGTDLNDLWAYDVEDDRWRELRPPVMPPAAGSVLRVGPMAYDSESERVILYQNGETWAYNSEKNRWTNMNPLLSPPGAPGRIFIRTAYDAESDRIILFGGRTAPNTFWLDTWAYDYDSNTWTQMHPLVSPSGRMNPGMVYDSAHDRIVMFGGAFGGQRRGDTWAYDYNGDTWTLLLPGSGPSPRGFPGMVYDSCARRSILFGGVGPVPTEITDDETWSYDYDTNAWTQLSPSLAPSPRAWHGMVYVGDDDDDDDEDDDRDGPRHGTRGARDEDCDDDDDRDGTERSRDDDDHAAAGWTILFGGAATRTGPATNDLWAYDSATNAWALVVDEPEDDDDDEEP